MGQEQSHKGYLGIGGKEPATINVNGRELTSYCDFMLRIDLLSLRRWQIVMAPDSEGDTCEQVLIPLASNGMKLERRGKESCLPLFLSAILCPSSFMDSETRHFLTQWTPRDFRERMLEEGVAQEGKWFTFSRKMGWMKPMGNKLAQGKKELNINAHGRENAARD